MRLEHLIHEPRLMGMLIPFGNYKNLYVYDCKVGDYFETIDDPPVIVEVVSKSIIMINSDIANSISMMLYNIPMSKAYEVMRRNWKRDINNDEVIFLVVKIVSNDI